MNIYTELLVWSGYIVAMSVTFMVICCYFDKPKKDITIKKCGYKKCRKCYGEEAGNND